MLPIIQEFIIVSSIFTTYLHYSYKVSKYLKRNSHGRCINAYSKFNSIYGKYGVKHMYIFCNFQMSTQ